MTLETRKREADAAAIREKTPYCVMNLNRVGKALYVVRPYDPPEGADTSHVVYTAHPPKPAHPFTLEDCNGESLEFIDRLYMQDYTISPTGLKGRYYCPELAPRSGHPQTYTGADEAAMWALEELEMLSEAERIDCGIIETAAKPMLAVFWTERVTIDRITTVTDRYETHGTEEAAQARYLEVIARDEMYCAGIATITTATEPQWLDGGETAATDQNDEMLRAQANLS